MKYRILAADDELELLDALKLFLERENIEMIQAGNGKEALELFRREHPHLVLLDIMMPEMDGFEVLRNIRKESKTPALMATAKTQLRRYYDYGSSGEPMGEIKLFSLTLIPEEGVLLNGTEPVVLTGTELRMLELFMKNPGRIFTKQQIFDFVWNDPYVGDDNTIMVHISNLRAKIEENPKRPLMLKTVKGLGYKFEKE